MDIWIIVWQIFKYKKTQKGCSNEEKFFLEMQKYKWKLEFYKFSLTRTFKNKVSGTHKREIKVDTLRNFFRDQFLLQSH